jgi:peptidoglycan-N-acetylglucosamine deacetylase
MGNTMRILPIITKMQRSILHLESIITNKPLVFDIHPNEFIDENSSRRIITRRSDNIIEYLFADFIRSKLKIKNLGPKALPLYINMLDFYKKKEYNFLTIKDYALMLNI